MIESLVPKKKLKKLKKKGRKKKLWVVLLLTLLTWLKSVFLNQKQSTSVSAPPSPLQTPKLAAAPPYNPSDPLTSGLNQARTYQANIKALAQAAQPGSADHTNLEQLSARVAAWTRTIEEIVTRTLNQSKDPLLEAERKRVPSAIKRLEKQLAKATDPTLRAKLERTLATRHKQRAQLEQLDNARQIAELKVENTLAQLGIIYSQLHSGEIAAHADNYAHLSAEIEEEVSALEDYVEALGALQHAPALQRAHSPR